MEIARGILAVAGVYGGIGLFFGLPFVAFGIQRVDPAARGTGWGFRLLVLPGVVALWPLLAMRWLRA